MNPKKPDLSLSGADENSNSELHDPLEEVLPRMKKMSQVVRLVLESEGDPIATREWNPGSRARKQFVDGHFVLAEQHYSGATPISAKTRGSMLRNFTGRGR
jgi:hypothetical protein